MKKYLFIALVLTLFSCDYIMKKDTSPKTDTVQKVVVGTDKDEKGCVISAGYRWSMLKDDCIRPIEEGIRLNTIELAEGESTYKSAFVTFDEDREQAELFLPDVRTSNILKKSKEGVYAGAGWKLSFAKGYRLERAGKLAFVGAEVQEGQITGDDKAEEE